ncbi:enoyl-CoA hydratase-related protein [Microlunatus sp. Gsoil 973]|uniref:enoyl-CoA hydratase-related protein n=1 Tax=Microlunatus sp. Gsoil 973 TaxID=2672569 RepID=UPI0012B4B39D|nr:enoyl-CoA hydratase-related protein [Microlunatus sp. Gsoil 973]QGN34268.1 enoyl-CoA hydratase [Microlunatus sp. Gsoil 973]
MSGQILEDLAGDTWTLTVSNPRRRNALSFDMYASLEDAFRRAGEEPGLRALVLRGADGHFAGGTDINELSIRVTDGRLGVEYEHYMARVQSALLDLRIPVIALVEGVCVGGGLVLAALSDIVYCTPDARFGSPIARTLGNTLSVTSLHRMYALLGRRVAARMLLTATLIDAETARQAGFVTDVVPSENLRTTLESTLDGIRGCSAESLWSFKELERRIDSAVGDLDVDDVYRRVYGSADFREGVDAFLAKRPARFGDD